MSNNYSVWFRNFLLTKSVGVKYFKNMPAGQKANCIFTRYAISFSECIVGFGAIVYSCHHSSILLPPL